MVKKILAGKERQRINYWWDKEGEDVLRERHKARQKMLERATRVTTFTY